MDRVHQIADRLTRPQRSDAKSSEREHWSRRWSPSGGPFFELGSLFVKLAGVELTHEPP
jgi:hypothetical protein